MLLQTFSKLLSDCNAIRDCMSLDLYYYYYFYPLRCNIGNHNRQITRRSTVLQRLWRNWRWCYGLLFILSTTLEESCIRTAVFRCFSSFSDGYSLGYLPLQRSRVFNVYLLEDRVWQLPFWCVKCCCAQTKCLTSVSFYQFPQHEGDYPSLDRMPFHNMVTHQYVIRLPRQFTLLSII